MARTQRAYELIIGQPVRVSDNYFSPSPDRGTSLTIQVEDFYDPEDSNSYLLNRHHIEFSIAKTTESNDNAEITVYNILDDTANYLVENRNSDLAVILRAGYNDDIKLVFQGTLRDCFASKEGETRKVVLNVSDGGLNTTNAVTSRAYPKGTPYQRIVDDLIFDMATPSGKVVEIPDNLVTPTSQSIFGNTYENIKSFTDRFNYTASIHNGQCFVFPKNQRQTEEAAFLSPSTGLIGSPQGLFLKKKRKKVTETNNDSARRFRVTCQLDGSILPSSSVYVQDPETNIDGAFKVEQLRMEGGYERGSWQCILDLIEIDATIS